MSHHRSLCAICAQPVIVCTTQDAFDAQRPKPRNRRRFTPVMAARKKKRQASKLIGLSCADCGYTMCHLCYNVETELMYIKSLTQELGRIHPHLTAELALRLVDSKSVDVTCECGSFLCDDCGENECTH